MAVTAAGTLGSRVLGLVRDQLTAYFLGAGMAASALVMAQTIPNLFRRLLGEGALTAALVPVMSSELRAGGRGQAFRLLNRLLRVAAPAMAAITLALMIAAFAFVQWHGGDPAIAPEAGVDGLRTVSTSGVSGRHVLAAKLVVWCMPYMPLACLAAVFAAALNILGKFGVTSLGPLLLNACIITSLCLGGFWFAQGDMEAIALWACGGMLAGGAAQLLAPALAMRLREGWRIRESRLPEAAFPAPAATQTPAATPHSVGTAVIDDPMARLRMLFLPALAGAGVQQLNLAVSRFLALGVDDHALTLYHYANRIVELPVGLFAITVATVIFPAMALCAARGERQRMGAEFAHGMRLILAINIPAAFGLFALCGPIVELLFEQGRFTATATAATLPLLCVFAAAMPFYGAIALMGRALNAVHVTRPQARLAVAVFLLNLALSPVLAWFAGAPGLACANLAGAVFQTVALRFMLRRHGADFIREPLLRPLLQCLSASAVMGAGAWAGWRFAALPLARWLGRFFSCHGLGDLFAGKLASALTLSATLAGAVALYFALLTLARYPEAEAIRQKWKRRHGHPKEGHASPSRQPDSSAK
jgi:putative peptidoglycan lipid II flippase